MTKSINSKPKLKFKIEEIYGTWEDSKTADDIIDEIEKARFNNRTIEEL